MVHHQAGRLLFALWLGQAHRNLRFFRIHPQAQDGHGIPRDPAFVVLGKRRLGATHWELVLSPYRGNAADAHNSISIMVDGAGVLHMAWDHHNGALRYAKGVAPGALTLGPPMPMTGKGERSADGGSAVLIIVVIAIPLAALAVLAWLVTRRRRRDM